MNDAPSPRADREAIFERVRDILDARITTKGSGYIRQAECYDAAGEIVEALLALGVLPPSREHMANARVFIQDALDSGFCNGHVIGNLMSARDSIDQAIEQDHARR